MGARIEGFDSLIPDVSFVTQGATDMGTIYNVYYETDSAQYTYSTYSISELGAMVRALDALQRRGVVAAWSSRPHRSFLPGKTSTKPLIDIMERTI